MPAEHAATVDPPPRPETNDEMLFSMRLGFLLRQRTYQQIADATGIGSTSVRRMVLNGRPSARLLVGLCQEFGVSPDWLLLGKGPVYVFHPRRPPAAPPASHSPSSDESPTPEPGLNRRAYRARPQEPADGTTASPS